MHFRRPCRVRFDLVVNLTAWPIRMRKKTKSTRWQYRICNARRPTRSVHALHGLITYPMLRHLYKRSCGSFARVSKKWKQSYDDLSIYILAYVHMHRNQFHFRKRRAESATARLLHSIAATVGTTCSFLIFYITIIYAVAPNTRAIFTCPTTTVIIIIITSDGYSITIIETDV